MCGIHKKARRATRGFTLLEILVAVFILSVIISIIYAAYSGTFSMIDSTTRETEIYAMARIAMERIVEDLESVYVFEPDKGYYGFLTTQGEAGGTTFTNLVFTSMAHLAFNKDSAEGTIAKIVYYVQEGDTEEVFNLCRSDQPNPDGDLESETIPGSVLCEGLSNISYTYYNTKGNSHDSWDSRSNDFDLRVPAMVTVQLSFLNPSDPESPYVFTTGVTLPAGL